MATDAAPHLEEYLNDLRSLRQHIRGQFLEAARWNQQHPEQAPITDAEVDPGGVLRAIDRQLWQRIGDAEVAKAMERFHHRLARRPQPDHPES